MRIAFLNLQASLIGCPLLLDVIIVLSIYFCVRCLLFPSKTVYKLIADKQPTILHTKVSMPGVICVY